MKNDKTQFRRNFIKSSLLGLVAAPVLASDLEFRGRSRFPFFGETDLENTRVSDKYPAIDDDLVRKVVGEAHRNFDTVKEIVDRQPELSKACWDWGFGDFETALGAASHMGRKDIAEYLIDKGARPDIFAFTMLGKVDVVKKIIDATPEIQRNLGPHGLTLLQHAKNRLRHSLGTDEKNSQLQMVEYLTSLGDADQQPDEIKMTDEEKEKYVGQYRFGEGENDVMEVTLNMRKMLSIGRKGQFGRPLYKTGKHAFSPSGTPSVTVSFAESNGKIISVTVHEPMPVIKAERI